MAGKQAQAVAYTDDEVDDGENQVANFVPFLAH